MKPPRAAKRSDGSLRLRLGAGLLRHLGLPPDVLIDLPRITLVGNLQLTLENHKGLDRFSAEELGVATRIGKIRIRGQDLVIGSVGADEIRVMGRIDSLQFEASSGKAAGR
ncbi:MAG: sporulation protein YqfC [bacterium]|nr:sporulation protein YqfC [bacterium]